MTVALPTPKIIKQHTIDSEVRSYYIIWKQIALLTFKAAEHYCHRPLSPDIPISLPDWNNELVINLIEDDISVPFVTLSSRPNAVNRTFFDYLIAIRGTMSTAQWGDSLSVVLIL